MLKGRRDKGGGSSVNTKEKPNQKAAKGLPTKAYLYAVMAACCHTWLERRKKNPAPSFSLRRGFICYSERNGAADIATIACDIEHFPQIPCKPHSLTVIQHMGHKVVIWQKQTEAFRWWCFFFSVSSQGLCKCPSALRGFIWITTARISYHLGFINKIIKSHQCFWKDAFSNRKHIHIQPKESLDVSRAHLTTDHTYLTVFPVCCKQTIGYSPQIFQLK